MQKLKKEKRKLTQERVREILDYIPETGALIWKRKMGNASPKSGTPAGNVCKNSGYVKLQIDGYTELGHRVIWLHVYGYMPEHCIDHIDRNRSNNAITNLREVSFTCNIRNSAIDCDNNSGVKGVYLDTCYSPKWGVTIVIAGKLRRVGYHKDFTEAVCHRYAAEQCLSWNDCDANSSAYQYLKQQGILKC